MIVELILWVLILVSLTKRPGFSGKTQVIPRFFAASCDSKYSRLQVLIEVMNLNLRYLSLFSWLVKLS